MALVAFRLAYLHLIFIKYGYHMEITADRHAMTLRDIIASFECTQQVPLQPTHRDSGTLDQVVTKVEQQVLNMAIDPPDVISDHSIVSWRVPFHHQHPICAGTSMQALEQTQQR